MIGKLDKLSFSGHESFQCRELWLKKGFDFVEAGYSFREPSAVVKLGIGKNMVAAIRYWMTAFDLLTPEKNLTHFAKYLFADGGKDPLIEDSATPWLLHYKLIKRKHASIYSLFFNKFRREKPEFTKEDIFKYLVQNCEEWGTQFSGTTLKKDVSVLFNTFLKPVRGEKNFKSLLTGLLVDLELLERIDRAQKDGPNTQWYRITETEREEIPVEVLLFCIMDNEDYGDSISLYTLLNDPDGIGSIFAMNSSGLVAKIKELTGKYSWITFMDDAGIKEVQFKDKPLDKWVILDNYYAK